MGETNEASVCTLEGVELITPEVLVLQDNSVKDLSMMKPCKAARAAGKVSMFFQGKLFNNLLKQQSLYALICCIDMA